MHAHRVEASTKARLEKCARVFRQRMATTSASRSNTSFGWLTWSFA
jgi:hypothetical protein